MAKKKQFKKESKRIARVIKSALPPEMPPLLNERQIEKLKTISSAILAVLSVAGAVTLSAVAPNMFTAIDKLFLKNPKPRKYTRKEKEKKLIRNFYYLKDHGLIIMKPSGKDFKIWLTSLGKRRLKKLNLDTLSIPQPKKWDGKWWQIAADIPTEDYKWAADLFRQKLRDMKFFPLQRTLWFYPYNPRREMEFLMKYFGIGRFVTVMEVSRLDLDDENRMREYFTEEGIL
ncbi:MAG: hypothetical protein HY396_02390 [Candidatus Doudnabacteria bacterium]|nr:hypothetical protein [Candidatus Doudnabacteria bacterium]